MVFSGLKPGRLPFDNTGVMFRSGSGAKLSSNAGELAVAVNTVQAVIKTSSPVETLPPFSKRAACFWQPVLLY